MVKKRGAGTAPLFKGDPRLEAAATLLLGLAVGGVAGLAAGAPTPPWL